MRNIMVNNRKFSLFHSNTNTTLFKDKNNHNPSVIDFNNFERKKIHPAIELFRELQTLDPSMNLQEFLSQFNEPRSVDADTFTKGIKKFIKLANSNPLDNSRKTLYGSIYSGLHYGSDLATLWNNSHTNDEPIRSSQISTLAPSDWDSVIHDGYSILIYRGQQPAQALDQLIKGPTVIDCGMYAQLSLWFGIRYMLGNERFNQYFGRAPFFITQMNYTDIKQNNEAHLGNPLYCFLSTKEQPIIPSASIKYIANTPLYHAKHPGGNYGGNNCVLIDNQYYIFDPLLQNSQGLTKSAILDLLRQAFNNEMTSCETDRLSSYMLHSMEIHPLLLQSYGELIEEAERLKGKKLTKEEFISVEQNPSLELNFDLHKFSNWLQAMENNAKPNQVEYSPKPIDYALMPVELLDAIPFENKMSMDFSKFKQETPQQKELTAISQQFCHSIMTNKSKLVTLTGKAGVGKTASAVCAAKELAANGKKIVWISEVMVHGWADQATSLAELDNCGLEIDNLLATNPDAIFLDDDNLTGFSGNLLLEKLYAWYVEHPGKGLFITSNESIQFKKCYGHKLDRQYHLPPFSHYNSPQYINQQYKTDLAGESLRSKRDGQSIGAIVSDAAWKMNESKLEQVELIPGFDEGNELAPMRRSLRHSGRPGDTYDKLRPIQQKWLDVHQVGGMFMFSANGRSHYDEPHLTANPSKFEKTACKTIALEIREFQCMFSEKEIDSYSIDQLIRVLNYAHDQGGRRIILINQTSFSHEELLDQIKAKLPKAERERTWSRLMLLLCETEDSIFKYDQFNGRIENTTPERNITNDKKVDRLSWFDTISSLYKKPISDTVLLDPWHDECMLDPFAPLEADAHSTMDESQLQLESMLKEIKLRLFQSKKDSGSKKSEVVNTQHEHDKKFGLILRK